MRPLCASFSRSSAPASSKTSSPARLVWRGGRQTGSITLYVYTDVSLETRHEEGDRLLVHNGERQMIFSASPDGPSLQEWHDAIVGAATDDPGGCASASPATRRPRS